YIFNDYLDREVDRQHPKKKFRPLASGAARPGISLMLMVAMVLAALSIAYYLDLNFLFILTAYLIINVFYTLGLKHISILDIFLVSSGFILRVYSGGVIGEVPISHWLVLMIMLLSLFLALAKRRDDIVLSKNGEVLRKASKHYNPEF